MTSIPLTDLRRSDDDRVVAGVCAGIAEAIDVDPTIVRLVFTLLALAGGSGIVLYAAVWLYTNAHSWWAAVILLAAVCAALRAFGLSTHAAIAFALIAAGLAVIWRRGGSLRRDGAPLSLAGIALAATGLIVLLFQGGSGSLLGSGAIAGALLMIAGPWIWQLAIERDAARTARIRSDERAEMAARIHDSVLQTLALIQRSAGDPHRVALLARRQERELRAWLYGDGAMEGTLLAALTDAAEEIEEAHEVRVELASGGDCALDDRVRAVVLAAREAMQNAAKFSGAEEISVYAEADDEQVNVFVRDRGAGFDPASVPADRRGIAESIKGRLARAGGTATVTSTPGEGTEVELNLPRKP